MSTNGTPKRIVLTLSMLLWPLLAMAALAMPAGAQTPNTGAAMLMDKQGKTVGNATFTESGAGVQVSVQVSGFAAEGTMEHGIHVHQTALCDPPTFESAGEHFNPTSMGHGMDNPNGPHAGDMPNITINADGTANYQTTSTMFTLAPGEKSIFDTDGSSLLIHENPDDYMTDPSGKSGGRIICGVIVAQNVTVGMPRTGTGGDALLWVAAAGMILTVAGLYLSRRRDVDQASV